MPPDMVWSERFNRSEVKLNFTQIGWKSLMNECLMGVDIYEKKENESEVLDPNLVMNLRHRMVKECPKTISLPQEQIHSEALKLLRKKQHEKLLQKKELKIIEKEVAKLKQSMDNQRLLTQKNLEETTNKRPIQLKSVKSFTNLWRNLEPSVSNEMDIGVESYIDMGMETKTGNKKTLVDVNESFKRKKTPKEKLVQECILTEEDEGKNEIMKRFFENNTQKLQQKTFKPQENDPKNAQKIKIDENGIKQTSRKIHPEKAKYRKVENEARKNKIEAFLTKLKEKETEKIKRLKRNKLEEREKIREKQDDSLKKLMQEVKTSKTEACQMLQEIIKPPTNLNPKFLKRMEERREERLKRKQELEEKKQKLEEERERAMKEMEEEKKREEEEDKKKRLEELKEKRRLEKKKKLEEEQRRKKLRENKIIAENHYRLYLLRSYGLRPWEKLMEIQNSQMNCAVAHFDRKLTQKVFQYWLEYVREQMDLKKKKAEEFYGRLLKKYCLSLWVEFHLEKVKQEQVAVDWNEFRMTERAFKKWLEFTQDEQMIYMNKAESAKLFFERKLKAKYLKKLQDYPELKKLERAKETRKQLWRQKVREIIPDYQPVDICDNF